MKILVLGAGKMGSFFIDLLSFSHEVAVYEHDPLRLRFTYNCQRFTQLDEIREFQPELVINAVTVKYTISAFDEVIPYLPKSCLLSDISSVHRFPLCLITPYVRTDICQSQPAAGGECHNNQ